MKSKTAQGSSSLAEPITIAEIENTSKPESTNLVPDEEKVTDSIVAEKQEIMESFFDLIVNINSLEDANTHFESLKHNHQAAPMVQTLPIYNTFLRGYARVQDANTHFESLKHNHQ